MEDNKELEVQNKVDSLDKRNKYVKKLMQALLFQVPAFASLLSYIPRRAVNRDDFVAYTDGKVIHLCDQFFKNYEPSEQGFIMLHECFHVILRHVTRFRKFATNEDALLWNLVTDSIINFALGAGNNNTNTEFKGLKVPKDVFDFSQLNKFLEITEDPILEYNLKNDKKIDWDAESLFKECKKRINNSPNKDKIEDKLKQASQSLLGSGSGGSPNPSQEKGDPNPLDGSGGSLVGDMMKEDLGEEGGRGSQYGEIEDLPEADSGRVGDIIWSKRVKAAAGQDPSGILKQLLGDLPKTNINWKKQLRNLIATRLLPNPKTDWKRPSRRTLSGDIDYFMPSRGRERGVKNIVCFHDASGSCWDDETVKAFLSNVESIQQKMKADLYYITFDSIIEEVNLVKFDDQPLSKKIINNKFNIKGGGGTSFQPCIEWLNESQKPADVAIIFTDGYAPMPSIKPKCPFIWAVVNNENFVQPFGKLVIIEDNIFS